MKNGFIKVATASPALSVADCKGNAAEIIKEYKRAKELSVKLLVFPELSVSSYSCGDLFRQRLLLDGTLAALDKIKKATVGDDMLVFVGFPFVLDGSLYNCAAAICGGSILGIVPKTYIPDYAEHYETRYFAEGMREVSEVTVLGETVPFGTDIIFKCKENPEFTVGAEICEDILAPFPPSGELAINGATVIVNLSASAESVGKAERRREILKTESARYVCAYLYANSSDGESSTDAVYSGHSLICENGSILSESTPFEPSLTVTEIDVQRLIHDRLRQNTFKPYNTAYTVYFSQTQDKTVLTRSVSKSPFVPENAEKRAKRCEDILTMQATALKKRVSHIGCKNIVVGISGGLDSCLALLVMVKAMDALKRPRTDITAVTMPCFGTTKRTKSNAERICEQLGVTFKEVNIAKAVTQHFEDIGQDLSVYDVTYENSQARERTQVLMDIANKSGGIVIGTGDLSELALGWATYNGDHMSMYGVNGGVPKTLVRHLVRHYADNTDDVKLADALYDILDTPVSPELIPPKDNGNIAQVTEDIVGPYELHDFFLYYFFRFGFTPEKIKLLAEYAFDGVYGSEIIEKWLKTFCRRFMTQQFKRSCLPDGPKIGSVSLSPRGDLKMASDVNPKLWLEG